MEAMSFHLLFDAELIMQITLHKIKLAHQIVFDPETE